MKVLITGGAGFIGYHLTNEFLSQGYDVTIVDNFSRGVQDSFLLALEKDHGVKFISADLMDDSNYDKLDKDFDYIVHLAAIIGVQNVINRPYDVLRLNVELLIKMIAYAKDQKNLKRFLFASTSEIYAGTLEFYDMEIPTPETTPLTITPLESPRTSYMLSKIYGEALLRQSGLKYTIFRPHNFYGPRMGMSHVIPEQLKKAYFSEDGAQIDVFSVNHKRTFCYISDAVRMIRLIAESDKTVGEAFNIGNERPEVTIQQVAETVLKVVGKPLTINPKPATLGSPERRCPSMKKMKEFTGYEGKVSLEEGIQKTFDWYKKNIFDGNEVCAK